MTEKFIHVAVIGSAFGLQGEIKARYSGEILRTYKVPGTVYLGQKEGVNLRKFRLLSKRNKAGFSIVRFEGIETREAAESLKGMKVFLPEADVPVLKKGEYYSFQIIGLKVSYDNKEIPGYTISDIMDNPAHPILLIQNGETEILVPFVEKFVGELSIEKGIIEIKNWPDWL
ncbi:MAG: 16S rRNA processing protein RimM [Leptospiraceae bacterium]|nr:16S rRNA processing protein RimM [Leptospiraceae bacterium]MCP5500870.1 16S rRNA processing protein RimM [Leptospiraceae bacterium]